MILLTLDFETAYGKHPVTGENITLSKMTMEEYVRHEHFKIFGVGLKWEDRAPVYWREGECDKLRALPWDDIALLCQNTMFDAFILSHCFGIHPALLLDTKCMSLGLYPQDRASLSYMVKRHGIGEKGFELVNTKDKWELTEAEHQALANYCAYNKDSDVNLTYKLFNIFKKDFPVSEIRVIDMTLKMYTDPILELNKEILEDHLYEVLERKRQLLLKAGHDITTLRSNKKFAALLTEHGAEIPMKLSPAALKRGEKKWTEAFSKTDEGMQALLHHPNEMVRVLAEVRLGVKSSIEETRSQRFIGIAERGKLPVALQTYGAGNTLRWSGLDKQNLQNLTRGGALRQSIEAPDGMKLVVADKSQIEARMLAWLAGQSDLLENFRQGKDPYCEQGTSIFQRIITKADALERSICKALVLGCGFGMGKVRFGGYLASGPLGMAPILFDTAFADKTGVDWRSFDPEDAKAYTTKLHGDDLLAHAATCEFLIDMYRRLNKQIKAYWKVGDRIIKAMASGIPTDFGPIHTTQDRLWMPNGLSLHYPNIRLIEDVDADGEPTGDMSWVYDSRKGKVYIYGAKMVENIVQALSRVVLAHSMLNIQKLYRIRLTVHDETICVVDNAIARQCLAECLEIMSTPPEWCADLPLAAEGDIADNYAEAK
jgi:DNA polymerase